MKLRQLFFLGLLGIVIQLQAITPTGNGWRCVLPASQYTPAETWKAQVMIFNDGQRYADNYYNQLLGTPPADINGREWYETDYQLTDGSRSWEEKRSPFSSDASYKNQPSSQWAVSDIMADIYLRRTFTVEGGFGGDLWLSCGHDDAPAEWYINGELVHTVSDGWNNDEIIKLSAAQKALIKTDGSENLIAVHVHQNWGGAFADCGLYEDLTKNTEPLLNTKQNGGGWPCVFYMLDSNDELSSLAPKQWAGRCTDEYDWQYGYGPFSSNNDYFLNTRWGSTQHPLLVRRHFELSADIIEHIASYNFEITCSYDEVPKVYLNGTLIWQASGWNDNAYATHQLTRSERALLREGDNVLAISLQSGGGSGHVDYGMNIITPYKAPTPVVAPKAAAPSLSTMVYDLMGRKHSANTPIRIINGKKIIK